MTKKELLETYREGLLQLDELQTQIEHVGSDGRPRGMGSVALDAVHGTNDPAAAARQLVEGLEAMATRTKVELAQMATELYALLATIRDYRTFTIIQRYYLMGETDASISMVMNLTRSRVNQIRLRFISSLDA